MRRLALIAVLSLFSSLVLAAAPTITGVVKLDNNFNEGSQLRIRTTGLSGGKPNYLFADFDFGGANAGDDIAESVTRDNGLSATIANQVSNAPTYQTSANRGDVAEIWDAGDEDQQTWVWDSPHETEFFLYYWWSIQDDIAPGCTASSTFSSCRGNMKPVWLLGPDTMTNDFFLNAAVGIAAGDGSDPGNPGQLQYGSNDLESVLNVGAGSHTIGVNESSNSDGDNWFDWTNISENWHLNELWVQAGSDPCDGATEANGKRWWASGNGDGTNHTEARSVSSSSAPIFFDGAASAGAGCGIDRLHFIGSYDCNSCAAGESPSSGQFWIDKLYLAVGTNAASRVYVGEAYSSKLIDSAQRELQPIDSWTNGSGVIVVTINSPSLTLGSGKYIFVCNEENECSAGFDLANATDGGGVFLGVQ